METKKIAESLRACIFRRNARKCEDCHYEWSVSENNCISQLKEQAADRLEEQEREIGYLRIQLARLRGEGEQG